MIYFKPLQFLENGSREKKEFVMNLSNASLEKIGVAVKKENDSVMKVAIHWVIP